MATTMDELRVVSFILNAALVPLVGWIVAAVRSMRNEVSLATKAVHEQNSRIAKLEQWTDDHEGLDTERSQRIEGRLDRIQTACEQGRVRT